MQLRSQFAVTLVVAAVMAGGWLWWSDGNKAAQSREPAKKRGGATLVLVEPAIAAEDKLIVRAIGTGEALKSASIYPSVSGEVTKVTFKAGQKVQKGALLLQLDDKHQRLAVRLAEVAVKETSRQLKRLEKLAPSGAASISRLETAQTTLESAKLRLDQARADLRDRSIYAPFEGVVGLTEIEEGDRGNTDTLIATLDDRSVILVEFNVPEEYAAGARVGKTVAIRPWTMRDKNLVGVISATGSRIDPQTRFLQVKAEIPNTDDAIRPGTSFDVSLSFVGGTFPRVREIAVLWSRDGAYLWRVTDKHSEKVFVKIVRRDKGRILVDGPLKAGDVIVVEGVQGLRQGQKVNPQPYGLDKAGGKASTAKAPKS